ncbi:hypothetical protein GCM10017557_71180 [Streptomyces aurantiacus]|uniref:Transposase InsH N-terminal domain-containing protein n=1 Tax=Streptomyces aurantiacus TaxID=47760 RepID=A0A7G1PA75_9ACTN|nr:hypothetical protein GCM10017557_71180 [Streptomyces aurantiacus]
MFGEGVTAAAGLGEIPAQTAQVAWTVCPKHTLARRLRDGFAEVFSAEDVGQLFPAVGRPAVLPGVLMLVTVLQFAEGLSARQTAEAIGRRIAGEHPFAVAPELLDCVHARDRRRVPRAGRAAVSVGRYRVVFTDAARQALRELDGAERLADITPGALSREALSALLSGTTPGTLPEAWKRWRPIPTAGRPWQGSSGRRTTA